MLADETTDNIRKELLALCVRYIDTDSEGKSVLLVEVIEIRDVSKQIRNMLNIAVFEEGKLSGENMGESLLSVLTELGLNTHCNVCRAGLQWLFGNVKWKIRECFRFPKKLYRYTIMFNGNCHQFKMSFHNRTRSEGQPLNISRVCNIQFSQYRKLRRVKHLI
jgi:hypothetical protein